MLKSFGTLGVLKEDAHNSDVCAEAIMRTLYDLLLVSLLVKILLRIVPILDRTARRLREEATASQLMRHGKAFSM
jgi:hypothetical protein